jgi:hypothetical protein
MENWPGKETSDIVYKDAEGVFTRLLVDKGYFASLEWDNKRPKYYIEVKATTSSWFTPFFVSQNQFDLIDKMTLPEHIRVVADEIYLIARVFNLGLKGMGLKLYLDPASLKRKHKLLFKADRYEVIPMV